MFDTIGDQEALVIDMDRLLEEGRSERREESLVLVQNLHVELHGGHDDSLGCTLGPGVGKAPDRAVDGPPFRLGSGFGPRASVGPGSGFDVAVAVGLGLGRGRERLGGGWEGRARQLLLAKDEEFSCSLVPIHANVMDTYWMNEQ
jgi:hypothetical protein